jgi:hypothetical protein
MNTIKIKKDNDPFKKYWWLILLGFAGIGAWICMPLMDTSVGSGSVRTHGLRTENQSLDDRANPNGAPGSSVDLSMGDAYGKRKADDGSMSSLYQPPPETGTGAAAAGAPLTASASFADALKEVSRKTDAAGWGGAAPQKGFTPPKANFSSLSGTGGSSGGSGASSGPSAGAFGTSNAKIGFAQTRGLSGSGASDQGSKPIMSALKGAASQGQSALTTKSNDAARAGAGAGFDGSRGGSSIGGGPGQGIGGSGYGGLDAAPANLKVNDPNANEYKIESAVGQYAAPVTDEGEAMKKAIMMMVISAVIGGVVSGVCGSIFGTGAASAASGAASAGVGQAVSNAVRPQGSGSGVGK